MPKYVAASVGRLVAQEARLVVTDKQTKQVYTVTLTVVCLLYCRKACM